MNNLLRTFLLLAALTALFMAVGYLIGGAVGAWIGLAVAMAADLGAYWNADRLMLSMHGARPIGRGDAPRLWDTVVDLAGRAGLPMPRLYIVDAEQPNAFATGRDPRHAAIAVTTGLIARLEDAEIAGVIAHELSHVIRRDTLTMTLAATLAGAVGMLAPSGRRRGEPRSVAGAVGAALAKGIAPLAAMVVRMAISHAREYEADRSGALLAGRPLSLADALEKLDGAARGSFVPEADRHPATAHLFIVNPLRGASLADLFGTHPPIAERVRRLKAMTGAAPSRFGPWDAEPWERA